MPLRNSYPEKMKMIFRYEVGEQANNGFLMEKEQKTI